MLFEDADEAALDIKFIVLLLDEAPLRRANATNAFLGFERFNKSLLEDDDVWEEDELELEADDDDGPFRNAGDVKMRGCKS